MIARYSKAARESESGHSMAMHDFATPMVIQRLIASARTAVQKETG